MHYTGTIWRPPYEASSLLLEATAGCTHHRCKFCTLYADLPFPFRMSRLSDMEEDLKEAEELYHHRMGRRMSRVFLTGANPFVLKYEKLMKIAERIRAYFPEVKTIGSFARVTDITGKTDEELAALGRVGYDGLTIGMETADETALAFMDKGYRASDILEQCSRLDGAGIHYSFFYLAGISGAGYAEAGAKATADVCNRLHPMLIGANMLTVYPDSRLYQEIRTLVECLKIPVVFAAMGASNAFQMQGKLPQDRGKLLAFLDDIMENTDERELRRYRESVHHL